ncbi:hypothetical protein [Staphylococcus lugdunensis]|uniref:hypothetical protein n=1 Tax=Staphylococcus lugdunensis TaxID=28035 RepID=UPI001F1CB439|nr:hypothetical protein [Staphylococcus lugdunensis]
MRPTEEQSLSHNNLELSDVITEDLSGNKKFVSVIDVPFKIALAKEYASTLTIGKDASNSFDKSQVLMLRRKCEFTNKYGQLY